MPDIEKLKQACDKLLDFEFMPLRNYCAVLDHIHGASYTGNFRTVCRKAELELKVEHGALDHLSIAERWKENRREAAAKIVEKFNLHEVTDEYLDQVHESISKADRKNRREGIAVEAMKAAIRAGYHQNLTAGQFASDNVAIADALIAELDK